MATRKLERSRPRIVVLIAVLLAVGPFIPRPPVVAAQDDGVSVVGRFVPSVVNPAYAAAFDQAVNPYNENVQLLAAPEQRILWAVDRQTPSYVAAYSLDTFQPLSATGSHLAGDAGAAVVDPDTGQLLVTVKDDNRTTTESLHVVTAVVGGAPALDVIPLGAVALRGVNLVRGMYRTPDTRLLHMMVAPFSATPGSVAVAQLRLPSAGAGAALDWVQPVPDCAGTVPTQESDVRPAIGYVASASSLYFGCAPAGSGGVPKPFGLTSGVGRLHLTIGDGVSSPQPGRFELYPRAGEFGAAARSDFDPGSGRLLLSSMSIGAGTTMYAFDGAQASWVGGVGLGSVEPTALDLDTRHARAYAVTTGQGLVVIDLSPTPVDQGRTFPEFKSGNKKALAVDPIRGRLVLPSADLTLPYRLVVQDGVPYYTPPVPPDPDAGTSDIEESPGITGATGNASAQGYGAIYRQIGGINSLQFNTIPVNLSGPAGYTREATTGYITKLTLDDGSASATAIGADRDGDTAATQGQAVDWPYAPAACSDFSGTPQDASENGASGGCDAKQHVATATAEAGPSTATNGEGQFATVAFSASNGRLTRDAAKGTVATVTSTAQGISLLGGAVRIGGVTVTSEAHAHGRPGTAGTSFVRAVENVTIAGTPLCSVCDPAEVAAAVNAAFPGRLRLDFPEPDAALAAGSPGGYQALSQRDEAQHVQEVQLNEQSPARKEVPGMIVTSYQDNTVPGRTLLYVAGTGVEAKYGIFALPQASGSSSSGADDTAGGSVDAGSSPGGIPAPFGSDSAATSDLAGIEAGLVGGESEAPSIAGQIADRIVDGVQRGWELLGNGLGRLIRLTGVWGVLLIPVYLSSRRWLLLSRGSVPIAGAS